LRVGKGVASVFAVAVLVLIAVPPEFGSRGRHTGFYPVAGGI